MDRRKFYGFEADVALAQHIDLGVDFECISWDISGSFMMKGHPQLAQ